MITLKDLRYYEDGNLLERFYQHAFQSTERYGDFQALISAEQRGDKKAFAEHLPDVKALMKAAIAAYLEKPFSDEDKAIWRAMDKALDTTNDSVGLFLMLKQGWALYLPIKPPMV